MNTHWYCSIIHLEVSKKKSQRRDCPWANGNSKPVVLSDMLESQQVENLNIQLREETKGVLKNFFKPWLYHRVKMCRKGC